MKSTIKNIAAGVVLLMFFTNTGCVAQPVSSSDNDIGNTAEILSDTSSDSYYGTWASSQYLTENGNMPGVSLEAHTLRQIVRTSIAGSAIRLRFSNRLGTGALELDSVHIALSAGSGSINSSTDTVVTFDGKTAVSIAAGENAYSDTFKFDLPAVTDIAVSIYFGSVPDELTGHPGSRTTSYIMNGDVVSAESAAAVTTADHWYFFSGIDIYSTDSYRTVVCFGDSITDGRGTTTNAQNRWTDELATILQQNDSTKNVGVINEGIGGTLVSSSGVERFTRDVISQPGVKYVIMLYGVNDIIFGGATSESIISVYKSLIKKAHKAGILAYGGTILPFGDYSSYTAEFEAVRETVNAWILNTSADDGGFDGIIDFASAVKDSGDGTKLSSACGSEDGLHPGPAGYKLIAETIDTSLLINTETPSASASSLTVTSVSNFSYTLPSSVKAGTAVTVTVTGTNSGTTGFRSWLIDGNQTTVSNQYTDSLYTNYTGGTMENGSFSFTYILTATETASSLFFKAPTYNTKIQNIEIDSLSITTGGTTTAYDPSEATVIQ
jgi:lysophospholipase L1-like esterase